MKRKWCAVCWLCLVCLIVSACESRGQNIEYLMKMGYLKRYQAFQVPLFPQLSNQIGLLQATDVANKAQKGSKPPLSAGRVAGEILAGGIGGIALGEAGEHIGGVGRGGGLVGGLIGYTLGSAIGVYAVGNIRNQTGSFQATWGGSILGFFIWSAGSAGIVHASGSLARLVFLAGLPIGATIGFNLTRRYKSPAASGTALINFSDGQMSLAVPTISFRPDPYERGTLTQRVELIRVSF